MNVFDIFYLNLWIVHGNYVDDDNIDFNYFLFMILEFLFD
jgi:hypothetical protein